MNTHFSNSGWTRYQPSWAVAVFMALIHERSQFLKPLRALTKSSLVSCKSSSFDDQNLAFSTNSFNWDLISLISAFSDRLISFNLASTAASTASGTQSSKDFAIKSAIWFSCSGVITIKTINKRRVINSFWMQITLG